MEITEANINAVSQEMVDLTENPEFMTYTDVSYASLIMENIAGANKPKASVGHQMVRAINNLLYTRGDTLKEAQKADGAAKR